MKIKYNKGGKPRRKSKRDISTNKTTSAAQNDKQRRVDSGLKVRREDYATGTKGKDAYLADTRASVAKRKEIREGFQNRIKTINQDFASGKIDAATRRKLREELRADKLKFTQELAGSSQGYQSEADRQGKRENKAISTINVKKKDGKRITNSTDEANAVRMTKTGKDAKKVVERRATKAIIRGDKDKRDVSIDEAAATKKKGFQQYEGGGKVPTKKKPTRTMTISENSRNQNSGGYVPPRNPDGSISIKANTSKLRGRDKKEFADLYGAKYNAGGKLPKKAKKREGLEEYKRQQGLNKKTGLVKKGKKPVNPKAPSRPKGFM